MLTKTNSSPLIRTTQKIKKESCEHDHLLLFHCYAAPLAHRQTTNRAGLALTLNTTETKCRHRTSATFTTASTRHRPYHRSPSKPRLPIAPPPPDLPELAAGYRDACAAAPPLRSAAKASQSKSRVAARCCDDSSRRMAAHLNSVRTDMEWLWPACHGVEWNEERSSSARPAIDR